VLPYQDDGDNSQSSVVHVVVLIWAHGPFVDGY